MDWRGNITVNAVHGVIMYQSKLVSLQRLAFIDAAILVNGYVGCNEIMRCFALARQAASKSITLYISRNRQNIYYCNNSVRYLPTQHFKSVELARFGVEAQQFIDALLITSIVDLDYVFEDTRTNKATPNKRKSETLVTSSSTPPRIFRTKYYSFDGEIRTISDIVKLTNVSKTLLYQALVNTPQRCDVNNIVDKLKLRTRNYSPPSNKVNNSENKSY